LPLTYLPAFSQNSDKIKVLIASRPKGELIFLVWNQMKLKKQFIQRNINIAVATEYGLGKYNLLSSNCEHFATLCVLGDPFSEQVNKLVLRKGDGKLGRREIQKEIEKTNRKFDGLRIQI